MPVKRKSNIRLLVASPSKKMTLQELREALNIQQAELGRKLGIKQAAVSRKERRSDIRLSHLKKTVEAMGGKLVITVHFPTMDVALDTQGAET